MLASLGTEVSLTQGGTGEQPAPNGRDMVPYWSALNNNQLNPKLILSLLQFLMDLNILLICFQLQFVCYNLPILIPVLVLEHVYNNFFRVRTRHHTTFSFHDLGFEEC